jgi:hypothetical protein
MPRYFFVVRHGNKTSDHSDGLEFPDISAVQLEAIKPLAKYSVIVIIQ